MEIVVAGCILKEGKVYLVKRDHAESSECIGKFEFPGGLVEENESPPEALIRELSEELSVDIEVSGLLHAQVNKYSNSGPYLVLYYLCYLLSEEQELKTPCRVIHLNPKEVKFWGTLPGTTEAAAKLEDKYTKVLEEAIVEQTPEFTARVLSYEIGDIHKLLIYRERFGSTGYLGDLQMACADAKTMVNLLSEQLGYNLEELKRLGLERFIYRMQEVKEVD